MKYRIATSPLSGRIFAGRLNKAGNAFLDGKVDATSDVLRAVVEKAEFHGGTFDVQAGEDKWEVRVTRVSP